MVRDHVLAFNSFEFYEIIRFVNYVSGSYLCLNSLFVYLLLGAVIPVCEKQLKSQKHEQYSSKSEF